MMRSIKGTLTSLTIASLIFAVMAVLAFSIQEHQSLYKDAVKRDLDALSENMSNDLLPILANNTDEFDLTTTLLRLDTYQNVILAAIYDKNWQKITLYRGKALQHTSQLLSTILPKNFTKFSQGVNEFNGNLIVIKTVGEVSLPQGYLVIINDAETAMNKSMYSLLTNIFPWITLLIILVIVGLLHIQNKLLAPLVSLSGLAKVVKQTQDYSLRFQSKGKSEIKRLAKDFNSMMATIESETNKNIKINKQLIEQQHAMERLANFDSLTGLPNRQFFMQSLRVELSRAERDRINVILMYLDLDGFKETNDTYGHDIGDVLLVDVAKRLKSYIRDGDVIARLGGDEFLILLHNEPTEYFLTQIAQRIVTGLAEPFIINEWELSISVSVGIAKAKDSNFNLSEFISNADIAMYRSKLAGRGVFTEFLPEMVEDNRRKLLVANAIIPALHKDKFEMYYQAKVDLNEEVVGFEALIRWFDDELGSVSPTEFIPIAEQTGKINHLTEWVLAQVFEDTPRLISAFNRDIKVAINLSALDIKRPKLLSLIAQLAQRNDVSPNNIEFEVTESAYLENFDDADLFLGELGKSGYSIALDDFGTGYSSLSYLTKIPINTLKIDKQFVDQLELSEQSTLITTTIIQMAKQLNLTICAEGVETLQQRDFLWAHHCQQLQGFLFAKPSTLVDILAGARNNKILQVIR
jgi:diguanylate cyclase